MSDRLWHMNILTRDELMKAKRYEFIGDSKGISAYRIDLDNGKYIRMSYEKIYELWKSIGKQFEETCELYQSIENQLKQIRLDENGR